MRNTDFFCTLFDSTYAARGLAMLRSLRATSDSHVYVLCMDDLILKVLTELKLEHVTLIRLDEFENDDLRRVKPTRSFGEYCWTCTPALIKFCLDTYELSSVTYIDADLYFFKSPRILLEEFELSGGSILLTEHRYSKQYDQSQTSGIYCVQFMTFKNDERGLTALNWWNERCIEWCYGRFEDGKFGDQKYLDDWTTRFEGVHVLQHLGGGVAPWNIQNYFVIHHKNGDLYVNDVPLVFYHFHNFKLLGYKRADLCRTFYTLTKDVQKYIYRPYVESVSEALRSLQKIKKDNYDIYRESIKGQLLRVARMVKGHYYVMEV